jgi:hypothetical protein
MSALEVLSLRDAAPTNHHERCQEDRLEAHDRCEQAERRSIEGEGRSRMKSVKAIVCTMQGFVDVSTRRRLAAGVVMAALAAACASNPAPTTPATVATSSTATAVASSALPKLAATFVSPWYGYSVRYPIAWTTTDGKGPWPPEQVLRHDDPRLDVIEGSTEAGQVRFVAASQPVPAGTTVRQFGSTENPFSCPPGDQLPKALSVDGAPASVTLNGCPSEGGLGGLIWDVVVISGGRGYDFTIDGALESPDAAAWLASIRLHPTSARS